MTGASGHAPTAHAAPPQVVPSAQGGSRLGRADLAGSARVEGQVTGDDIIRLLAQQAPPAQPARLRKEDRISVRTRRYFG